MHPRSPTTPSLTPATLPHSTPSSTVAPLVTATSPLSGRCVFFLSKNRQVEPSLKIHAPSRRPSGMLPASSGNRASFTESPPVSSYPLPVSVVDRSLPHLPPSRLSLTTASHSSPL